MSALKDFTPTGREQLARVLRARATPAVKRSKVSAHGLTPNQYWAKVEAERAAPVQPELALEPWVDHAEPEFPRETPVINPHHATFTLAYPPAVNRLYGVRAVGKRVFPYKTHEHRDYMADVGKVLFGAPLWAGPLAVRVKLYRPRRIGDIDGPLKALFDALNGRAWADDSQVVELHVTRHDDKHRPRVEVAIHAAQPEDT